MDRDLLSELAEEENSFNYDSCKVACGLDDVAEAAVGWASPPPGMQTAAVLAGFSENRPILAE